MYRWLRHIRLLLTAVTALALSASLAFAATPPAASTGLANAAAHAGKTVPVAGGDETLGEDETTETTESADETETTETETDTAEETETESADESATEDAADNCTTDPTTATPDELAAMNHGAVVCWAAHQTDWPTWFTNHGAFVRCWAHQGKADAASCTEDPTTVLPTGEEPTTEQAPAVHGKGHGHGKAYGKLKHQG